MPSETTKAANKAKRKEQDELNYRVATAAEKLESQLDKDMQAEAERLGVDISALRARFLMYASHRCDTQPTVWNGLVHVKSEEWADMKDQYPGRAFLAYVVERIHNEDLYNPTEMSDEEKDGYIQAAQDARKAKLNAGIAKTTTERFVQGTVKHEISAICNRLDYLHSATSIECLLFVVKGRAQDGLAPTYHTSDKARTFIESHLKASVPHLLDLMESSSIGGSAALTLCHQNKTQLAKSQVRRKMLMSCRDAATSVAEDGSPPMVTDPLDIAMVEYKNYIKFVEEYKTVMVGWPFTPEGSLVDPSSMGLGKLEHMLKLLEDPDSDCGFKRLTEAGLKEWLEELDKNVKAGKVQRPTRKTRSDAGTRRRKATPVEANGEANPASTQKTKPKTKKASAPKARDSRTTEQKKSSASNRSPSRDSLQETHLDATSDRLSHPASPDQHAGAQDTGPADDHFDLPPPSDILRNDPAAGPTTNTRGVFDFRAADVHPTAPRWPAGTQSRPSTPQPDRTGLDSSGARAQGSSKPGPSTPTQTFRFVMSTPEREAARANAPRRTRSRSPTVSGTSVVPRTPSVSQKPPHPASRLLTSHLTRTWYRHALISILRQSEVLCTLHYGL